MIINEDFLQDIDADELLNGDQTQTGEEDFITEMQDKDIVVGIYIRDKSLKMLGKKLHAILSLVFNDVTECAMVTNQFLIVDRNSKIERTDYNEDGFRYTKLEEDSFVFRDDFIYYGIGDKKLSGNKFSMMYANLLRLTKNHPEYIQIMKKDNDLRYEVLTGSNIHEEKPLKDYIIFNTWNRLGNRQLEDWVKVAKRFNIYFYNDNGREMLNGVNSYEMNCIKYHHMYVNPDQRVDISDIIAYKGYGATYKINEINVDDFFDLVEGVGIYFPARLRNAPCNLVVWNNEGDDRSISGVKVYQMNEKDAFKKNAVPAKQFKGTIQTFINGFRQYIEDCINEDRKWHRRIKFMEYNRETDEYVESNAREMWMCERFIMIQGVPCTIVFSIRYRDEEKLDLLNSYIQYVGE